MYEVDEQGRTYGFTPVDLEEVDAYGGNLEGAIVESTGADEGRTGLVTKVYGHIQTGNPGSGASNFVAVDITWDN